MSGHSYEGYCPNCQEHCTQAYSDTKPFSFHSEECLQCGFIAETRSFYLDLEELNERRKMMNENFGEDDEDAYEMLTELPAQNEEYCNV